MSVFNVGSLASLCVLAGLEELSVGSEMAFFCKSYPFCEALVTCRGDGLGLRAMRPTQAQFCP